MGQKIDVPGRGIIEFPDGMSDDDIAAAIQKLPSPAAEMIDNVKKSIPDADKAGVTRFMEWLNTQAGNTIENIVGAPGAGADMSEAAIAAAGKFFGIGPRTSLAVARIFNMHTNPTGLVQQLSPRISDARKRIDAAVGATPRNAPESWGTAGKVLDATTQAVMGAPLAPGSVVRNLLPAIGGAVGSELAGAATEGTWAETPARIVGGLVGGTGTAAAQNYTGNVARGAANLVGPRSPGAEEAQAQRILGRNLARDLQETPPGTPMPTPAQRHAEFLPGTPFAYTVGPNTRGAFRGTGTMMGPARRILETGEEAFIENGASRINPLIEQVSPLPTIGTRVREIEAEAAKAGPIYKQAGVPDDPQMILTQRAGAPVTTTDVGPDFMPVTTTRPGPPVVDRSFNTPTLQSPELMRFIENSDDIKQAIARARGINETYQHLPPTSMSMIDEIYKALVGKEQSARGADRNTHESRLIGNTRRQFAELIAQENPEYGRALAAWSGPQSKIDAARRGHEMAAANAPPDELGHVYRMLQSDEHRAEFRGGYMSQMREAAGRTDRRTPADRIWDSPDKRARVAEMLPPDTFSEMNRLLLNEREAARNMNKIRGGSNTANKAMESADVGAGDAASLASDLVTKNVKGVLFGKMMEAIGGVASRTAEGRNERVNAAIARMGMETDPAAVSRSATAIDRAREAYARTEENRRRALQVGAGMGVFSGLLSP